MEAGRPTRTTRILARAWGGRKGSYVVFPQTLPSSPTWSLKFVHPWLQTLALLQRPRDSPGSQGQLSHGPLRSPNSAPLHSRPRPDRHAHQKQTTPAPVLPERAPPMYVPPTSGLGPPPGPALPRPACRGQLQRRGPALPGPALPGPALPVPVSLSAGRAFCLFLLQFPFTSHLLSLSSSDPSKLYSFPLGDENPADRCEESEGGKWTTESED